jgi:hypothetical protein
MKLANNFKYFRILAYILLKRKLLWDAQWVWLVEQRQVIYVMVSTKTWGLYS